MTDLNIKKYLSEVIGTFAIVFCGTGSIVINGESGGIITHVGIAITFGLIVTTMIYALGDVSGAHFNPAVSIAFTLAGKFSLKHLLPYIFSQVIGAVLASLLLKMLFPDDQFLGATLPNGPDFQSFVLELILTFFLMLVIMNVAHGAKEKGMFAGLAIGFVVLLEAMNPARSIGPALVSGHLEHLWIYLLAPVLGASLGVMVWKYLSAPKN